MSEKNNKKINLSVPKLHLCITEIEKIANFYDVLPHDLMSFILSDWLMHFHITNDTYNPDRVDIKGTAMVAYLSSIESHQKTFEEYIQSCKKKQKSAK